MLNVTTLEAAIRTKTGEIETLLKGQMETAEKEQRARTAEEVAAVDKLLAEARDLKGQLDRKRNDQAIGDEIARITSGLTPVTTPAVPSSPARTASAPALPPVTQTWGQQFVASAAFEFFKAQGHRTAAAWRSPSVEFAGLPMFHMSMFGTTITSDPSSGGALIVPEYRPGILERLTYLDVTPAVADLLASGTTSSNLVTYMREKTFTNNAATVAEGAAKPESALVFEAAQDAVRKIAHWLPVTEEMLEDAPQIRSYIDSRLLLGVRLVEDQQLLNGDGVAPNILGIRNRPGLAAPVARGTASNADAIYTQISAIATTAFVQPDGVVMNPANWTNIELLKSTTGEYLAGGPFASRVSRTLWGVRVVLTPAATAGIATVGAYGTQAQFFRKDGVRVEASNSHQDFFIKNLVAIRAEERGALCVYRPGAFGDVTGLN